MNYPILASSLFLTSWAGADPDLWKGVQNELRHYIVWFGKVRQKKRSQPADNNIAAHLTNYTFTADKVHKNPYIAHYTLF